MEQKKGNSPIVLRFIFAIAMLYALASFFHAANKIYELHHEKDAFDSKVEAVAQEAGAKATKVFLDGFSEELKEELYSEKEDDFVFYSNELKQCDEKSCAGEYYALLLTEMMFEAGMSNTSPEKDATATTIDIPTEPEKEQFQDEQVFEEVRLIAEVIACNKELINRNKEFINRNDEYIKLLRWQGKSLGAMAVLKMYIILLQSPDEENLTENTRAFNAALTAFKKILADYKQMEEGDEKVDEERPLFILPPITIEGRKNTGG